MSMTTRLNLRVVAALAVTIFAMPCFAQAQSEARYEVIVERDVMVPMRDGTRLAIDIYRPDAEGSFPALVERTPYDKTRSSEIRAGAHSFFAERGYAFLVQDVRGRYASEGDFYPFRDAGWGARRDGFDTVQWIADQPWSNGTVGVVGGSHTGQTAYMLAPTQPPALAAMFVRESASDLHKHWIWRGGAFEHGFVTAWVGRTFAADLIERTYSGDRRTNALAGVQRFLDQEDTYFWYLPVERFPPFRDLPELSFYSDWLAHPADGPYWWRQNVSLNHHLFTVPVAHLGGWYDIFLQGTLENYLGLKARAATALARDNQKLVIGPWVHGPTNVGVAEVGAMTFPGADSVQYNDVRLRWFDHWLRGIDNGVADAPPVLIYVMGDNEWRQESEWPLARTAYTKFYFHAGPSGTIDSLNDGTLSRASPGEDEQPATFRYDPSRPVPTLGGNTLFIASGPQDHRGADALSLTYTSEILPEDLEVTGPVTAVLYATSTAVDTDWTVRLSEVYPDGRAINIVDGILRARYRDSAAEPTLIEPGKITRYDVDLWATSNVFQAGNRLRVSVHSSNFPRWSRNLNVAETPETAIKPEVAYNTVLTDAAWPSHVVLPVIPR
jgi:putative CocE/NonD family hydrolase